MQQNWAKQSFCVLLYKKKWCILTLCSYCKNCTVSHYKWFALLFVYFSHSVQCFILHRAISQSRFDLPHKKWTVWLEHFLADTNIVLEGVYSPWTYKLLAHCLIIYCQQDGQHTHTYIYLMLSEKLSHITVLETHNFE